MKDAVISDYRRVIVEAEAAEAVAIGKRKRTLARLRRELRRIRARDYFPSVEREAAEQAVETLAMLVEEPVG